MAYAIVQDGVIMGLGASASAAEDDAEETSLSAGLCLLDATARCVHASEQALRDWQENGPAASVYINDAGEVRSRHEASNDVEGELSVSKVRLDVVHGREILAAPADLSMRSCKAWIARIRLDSYRHAPGSAERRAYLAEAHRSVGDAAFAVRDSKATSRYLKQEAEKLHRLIDSADEPA